MIKAFIIYGNDGCHPIFAEFLDVVPHKLQYYMQNEPFQKISDDILQEHDLKVHTEHYHSLRLVVYTSRGMSSGEGKHFLHVIKDMLVHLFNHGTERCVSFLLLSNAWLNSPGFY
ncbi:uncharacterized protein LOC136029424 isoform X2 [Artemia franciscana]|uniref:Uncharacterized protein n=1 Tax=Artemia franciscana TaxID=6661 RepID=A0AA88HLV9_ARTSF|nr:hypothetical protein QYM36_015700 [Artemia franciscana]